MATRWSTKAGSGIAIPDDDFSSRSPLGAFPRVRMRRNRQTRWLRALVSEHRLSTSDLIWPIFVVADRASCRAGIIHAGRAAPDRRRMRRQCT